MISKSITLSLSAVVITISTSAMAAEEGVPAQPPQTHDIRAAELPPTPGLYFSTAIGHRSVVDITNENGDGLFNDTDVTQQVFGVSALYVLPKKYKQGSVGFFGVTTWQTIEGTPGGPIPSEDTGTEWVDAVLGAVWSFGDYKIPEGPLMGPPPGTVYAFGLQTTIPGGDGSLESLVISPNVSLTARTEPQWLDGTEFSGRLSYNLVSERDSNIIPGFKYEDGDYLSFDFAVTERYKFIQFGLVGTLMHQMVNDKPGAGYPGPVAGRMKEKALGAVINIDLGPTSAIKMRYTKSVDARSMAQGNNLGILYLRKL